MSDRKKQGCDEVEDNYYQWDESSVADIGEEKFSEIAQHKSGDIDEGTTLLKLSLISRLVTNIQLFCLRYIFWFIKLY